VSAVSAVLGLCPEVNDLIHSAIEATIPLAKILL